MSAFGNGLAFGFMQGMMFNNMLSFGCNPFFSGFCNPFFGGFMPFNCWSFPIMPFFGGGYSSFPTYNDTPNHRYDNLLFDFSPAQYQYDYNWNNTSWNYENYNVDTFIKSDTATKTTSVVEDVSEVEEPETEVLPPVTGAEVIIEQIEAEQKAEQKPEQKLEQKSEQKPEQSESKVTNPVKPKTDKSNWTQMTDEEMRNVYGNYTRDITVPYNGSAETLNEYLKNEGVLAGKGQAFMDAQEKYGISASVLAAICINESKHGTSLIATDKNYNNVGGVRKPRSTEFKDYPSVEACISDMGRFLNAIYVHNKRPLTKLYQVNAQYCPVHDKTDKKGGNYRWASTVEQITAKIEKTAKQSV